MNNINNQIVHQLYNDLWCGLKEKLDNQLTTVLFLELNAKARPLLHFSGVQHKRVIDRQLEWLLRF